MKKILLAFVLLSQMLMATEKKTNVIYIMCDDLGIGELGCYGQELIKTPEIDRMAAEGMLFSDHYSGSAVCAPTRDALLSGKHTGHTFIRANWKAGSYQEPIPAEVFTIGEMFQNAGYVTGGMGKWGLGGPESTGHPNVQGFDHFYGYLGQVQAHSYYPDHLWRNNEMVYLNNTNGNDDYSHDRMADEALWFMEQHKDEPFFCYIPFTIPHTNFEVPELGQYATGNEWSEKQRTQAAMISRMDADVGQILDSLNTWGIAENTLVIFTSDNGAHGAGSTIELFDSNGPFRSKKRNLYEGGIRAPHIAWWPSTIAAGSESDHISAMWDFFPTCCEIVGQPIPEDLDGKSYLSEMIGNEDDQEKHDFLYWEIHESGYYKQAVRVGDWKGVRKNINKGFDQAIELYNLVDDISESTDISLQHPNKVMMMDYLMLTEHTPHYHFNFKQSIDINLTEVALVNALDTDNINPGDTLQLSAVLSPANAYDREMVFEIQSSSKGLEAAISPLGQLVVSDVEGYVDVKVSSVMNPSIYDVKRISVGDVIIPEESPVDYVGIYESLVFYYPFEDSYSDDSNEKNEFKTIHGVSSFEEEGQFGNCLVFHGDSDYLQTEQNIIDFSATPFTISLWVKVGDDATDRIIFQQEAVDGNGRSLLYLKDGGFASYLGGKTTSSTGKYSIDEWTHVALVGNPVEKKIQFYVNGIAGGIGQGLTIESSKGEINIGRHKVGQLENRLWDGAMDEVMLFTAALTDEEVKAVMDVHFIEEKKEAKLLAMQLNETSFAQIDEEERAIDFDLANGTDLTQVQTDVFVSKMASVSPDASSVQDFSSTVKYTVTAYDGTIAQYQVRGDATSIQESIIESVMKIFPNPARERVVVEMKGLQSLNVYNLSGMLLIEELADSSSKIEMSIDLPEGTYLLSAVTENGVFTQKLQVE